MTRKIIFLTPLFLLSQLIMAQDNSLSGRIEIQGGYCGPKAVPFWLRSNRFGNVPPSGASMGLIGSVQKAYKPSINRQCDWGFSAEGRFNAGKPTEFILTEGYGKFRYGIFELKAGRVKDITGLCDTLLSSGSWSVSGNAPGIPKIELSVPEFVYLPFFSRLFAIKLSYINGIMGNWYINNEKIPNTPTYLMQHTFYGRIGKPDWKLKLYGGFNHQTVWGNEKETHGEEYKLSPFETFLYANIAKRYNNGAIQKMRVGNHMGSIDLGATYDFDDINVFIYRQFFYDAGALYYLANLRDGLNGLSLTNRKTSSGNIQWQKIVLEFLYTKNQAGEIWSPPTAGIFENYYNNGYYEFGWSYKGNVIGNPFISSPGTIREDLPLTEQTFDNNRVIAWHCGMQLRFFNWIVLSRLSYSQNYGNYFTSEEGKIWDGENTETPYGIFPETKQFSGYLQAVKELKNRISVGITCAIDHGGLFEDGFGIFGSVGYSFRQRLKAGV